MASRKPESRNGNGSATAPTMKTDVTIFVSMPFAAAFDSVYVKGIRDVEQYLPKFNIQWIRLDRQAYRERSVEDNVLKEIDSADLLIADISRYPDQNAGNVSVMHEIGYAQGRGINFILAGKAGTHKNLPANLKSSIITEYRAEDDNALKAFGRTLALQVEKTVLEKVIHSPHGGFRVEGFTERSKISIPELIRHAKRRIAILTTNLNYTDIFLKAAIQHSLEANKENQSFRVEILTMDPESDVANARASQLGKQSVRHYRDELRKSLDNVRRAFANYRNVEIITYRSLPTQMTFMIDDAVIVAVVSLGHQSRDGIHFVLSNSSTTAAAPFQNHFTVLKTSAAQRG